MVGGRAQRLCIIRDEWEPPHTQVVAPISEVDFEPFLVHFLLLKLLEILPQPM